MKSFKGYVNEAMDFSKLVKISVGVEHKNDKMFEALLKKEDFGYNGPMVKSRYEKLDLDEFIIVGPDTPIMKWVSKNKKLIVKLTKLPLPKITFASVDVNQYEGEELTEKLSFTKDFHKNGMSKKQKDEFDKLYKKMDGGKEHQAIKRLASAGLNSVEVDDMFHALVMKKVIGEAIQLKKGSLSPSVDNPAFINVTLQDFAKHMKRIKPHAKKAGTKLTVQGSDVKVDGLATAIKKMFDYMTSDGKGFYE